MSRYQTEEEQVEAFKQWWNKNGTQLLSAILVVVIAVSGWRYWSNTQYVESANASAMYELLQMRSQQGQFGEVSREALKLMQEQPDSPYAAAAAMLHAKYSFEKGEKDEAIDNLNWVSQNATDNSLKSIAQLRIARIYLDNQQFDKAAEQLKAMPATQLTAVQQANYDYVSGLLALQQGDITKAQQAFKAVVDNSETEKSLLGLAQIQLDDLAQ
ncbi:YfgM family protein [Thiomicrorhabdus sediminis]|uniref:Ancillary SecYEG translocon subunit n=1 Tax=Thiomicrorhabdus sediminis TaxID=2580412 RepID=A0A4P9K6S0_9GAMM|nr:tetratricopeptide repeat protein [Thiomicrorhabdus sediminis]QCU90588.1 tetratricopeptide repeat protein [Thiomicrorhabdus sediminis]